MRVWVLLTPPSCGNPCDDFGPTVLVLSLRFLARPHEQGCFFEGYAVAFGAVVAHGRLSSDSCTRILSPRPTSFFDPQDREKGPVVFPSLSDIRLQFLTDKGHLGKGKMFGHGRLKRLQHRHRRRVVGPD